MEYELVLGKQDLLNKWVFERRYGEEENSLDYVNTDNIANELRKVGVYFHSQIVPWVCGLEMGSSVPESFCLLLYHRLECLVLIGMAGTTTALAFWCMQDNHFPFEVLSLKWYMSFLSFLPTSHCHVGTCWRRKVISSWVVFGSSQNARSSNRWKEEGDYNH